MSSEPGDHRPRGAGSPPPSNDLRRLAGQVADRLRHAGETLATAESCTGGMIAAALTAIPGASDVFWGGAVVYSVEAKGVLAGVDPEVVQRHGPVSTSTSEALATAIRGRAGSTYGLAVTGWAGPSADPGGEVGEVHGALSHASGVRARTWRLEGDRDAIRTRAATEVLGLLLEHLRATEDGVHE